MSTNCLVTKLKGTVDNPNLPKYGALYVEHLVNSDQSESIEVYGNNGDRVTVNSDEITEIFDYSGNSHTLPWTTNAFAQSSTYAQTVRVKQKGKLYFTSKYDINGIGCENRNDNHFAFLGTFDDIVYKNVQPSNAFSINLGGNSDLKGNISTLLTEDIIGNLTVLDVADTSIEGTAADLGKFINATALNVLRSKITGSIEDIVNSQIAAGVTTRDDNNALRSNACLYQFTFGGIKVPSSYVANGQITWESESKIAVHTGSIASEPTNVVCKGYTQEEAEAKWPGKTIFRVDA